MHGQNHASVRDSIVTVLNNGNVLTTYVPSEALFVPARNQAATPDPYSNLNVEATHASSVYNAVYSPLLTTANHSASPNASVEYSVGSIPFSESTTPTGGRTYEVPIITREGSKLPPEVSIFYNSQASDAIAGYGWSIGGMSAITLSSKSLIYNGTISAASLSDSNPAFSLDGEPIVETYSALRNEYPYMTARSNIYIKKHTTSSGAISHFTVLYPDGKRGTYGWTNTTGNRHIYPLTKIEDIQGRKCTITYDQSNNYYRPLTISYDYDGNNNAHGRIVFNYDTRPAYPTYYAGITCRCDKLLSSVSSYNDTALLGRYDLEHEQRHGTYLLTSIDLSNGNQNLSPLRFSYKEEPQYQDFILDSDILLATAFTGNAEIRNIRGKFVPGEYSDGIISLPVFSNYKVVKTYTEKFLWIEKKYYEFGSGYSPDQSILIAPRLGYMSGVQIIKAEEGFQAIEALDIDMDGVDEIVKVNFNGLEGEYTKLRIKIYRFNSSATQLDSSYFDVKVNGVVADGDRMKSPMQRQYFWGRFNDTGHAQLLTISYNKDFRDNDRESYTAVVDLVTRSKSEYKLFDLARAQDYKFLIYDMDCDGKTDLCLASPSGLQHYSCNNSGYFSLDKSISGVNDALLRKTILFGDMNADGYIDIVEAPEQGYYEVYYPGYDPRGGGDIREYEDYYYVPGDNKWNVYSFTGSSFVKRTCSAISNEYGDKFELMDVNNDGLSDLIKISGRNLFIYPNNWGEIRNDNEIASTATIPSGGKMLPANTLNNGRITLFVVVKDFTVYSYSFSEDRSLSRLVIKCEDSYGNESFSTYKKATDRLVYQTDPTRSYSHSNGFFRQATPINVLYSSIVYDGGTKLSSEVYYTYYDAITNSRGLGFSGFGKILSIDYVLNNYTTRILDPERYGIETQVSIAKSYGGTPYSTISYSYDNHYTYFGILNPRLVKSIENDALTGIKNTTEYTHDNYDYPTKIVNSRCIGSGSPLIKTTERSYGHSITGSKYVLGIVTEESTITERDGDNTLSWKEKDIYTYDSYFRPITNKHFVGKYGTVSEPILPSDEFLIAEAGTREGAPGANPVYNLSSNQVAPPSSESVEVDTVPISHQLDSLFIFRRIHHYDADNLVVEKRWQYDSYGNMVSEKSAPYGCSSFTGVTYTYDSNGLYLLSETNALGQTTTYHDYNKYGKATRVTDYRNRVTINTYDSWGQLITCSKPDGTIKQTIISWGGEGLYTVKEIATGAPEKETHYDSRGREIKSGVKRFDGQWQWTNKEYDNKGRLLKISLPYRGGNASYWNTISYDEYDRPISISDGFGRISTWSYNATNVTTQKEGLTSTRCLDAEGKTVSVSDAGGTVSYSFRDDGQPLSVRAPGNVITTFSYDDYGRKTTIVDPCAGTESDSYIWNNDGSSVNSHTGPNGSVVTYKDKYGRTTLIERPGEYNTSYSYDTYGRLVLEQSTNGTGIEYSYDTLDRIVTSKETVPDGKWLRKSFNYGSGSILESIQYTTQSGTITTESYSYSNGYVIGITLPDNTVVWGLESENDLGMATEITSGAITREYGFTPYGMPVYRKMDGGALQDYTYQFDANTGNLLLRQDGINGLIETFGYDNLNRLTGMGNRHITYDDKGNILSMSGVGRMSYKDPSKPYQLTSLIPYLSANIPSRQQDIVYTCYSRPSILIEGERSAAFTYNGTGDRVKMYVAEGTTPVLTRYYVGGQYEYDQTPGGTKERLYLDGDAYSSPMVLQRENGGSWTAYNIGRDYLGNITHIATLDGTLVAEYSYDPWGRLRNPSTLEIYAPGSEPELFLGRGFTGHEHMTWFGLINMNARLYDPLLGRFLSPDSYVQNPYDAQNFNRYTYCLNNPLKYTDPSGAELTILGAMAIGAVIFGAGNLIAHAIRNDDLGHWNWAKYLFSGAIVGAVVGACAFGAFTFASGMASTATTCVGKIFWSTTAFCCAWGYPVLTGINLIFSGINGLANNNKQWFRNFFKTFIGNFYLDENKSILGEIWEGISRFTWEGIQQFVGYACGSIYNGWNERVDLFGGATFGTNFNSSRGPGFTIGSFIHIDSNESSSIIDKYASFDDYVMSTEYMAQNFYIHEYGHTVQSGLWGPLYLFVPAACSLYSAIVNSSSVHDRFWTEKWANTYSKRYFAKHFKSYTFPSSLITY